MSLCLCMCLCVYLCVYVSVSLSLCFFSVCASVAICLSVCVRLRKQLIEPCLLPLSNAWFSQRLRFYFSEMYVFNSICHQNITPHNPLFCKKTPANDVHGGHTEAHTGPCMQAHTHASMQTRWTTGRMPRRAVQAQNVCV